MCDIMNTASVGPITPREEQKDRKGEALLLTKKRGSEEWCLLGCYAVWLL
jgi:hypothetical protein